MIAEGNTTRPALSLLTTRIHRQIIDAMDLSRAKELSESDLRQQLEALAAHLCAKQDIELTADENSDLVSQIMDEIYGLGPLQPLIEDPEVTGILVNGFDNVLAERRGRLESTRVGFADEEHLRLFIERTVTRGGRRIDEGAPIAEVRLPDGSIFSAVLPPLAVKGPNISIRRFANRRLNLEDMVKLGSLSPEMANFLILAVRNRANIVFSGGSGAGKTALLNGLTRFIPRGQRIVTIEETPELQLRQNDVISLQTRPANVEGRGGVGAGELVRTALRMRPDRILLGETRGDEVLDVLQAMNTGHHGSMTTIHANDSLDALERMELMAALSRNEPGEQAVRRYIARAVDFVVHVSRLETGERKITRISEVRGLYDGEYAFEDIFVYRENGTDDEYHAAGSFYATGYEPLTLKTAVGQLVEPREYRELFIPRELTTGVDYLPMISS